MRVKRVSWRSLRDGTDRARRGRTAYAASIGDGFGIGIARLDARPTAGMPRSSLDEPTEHNA